MEEGKNEEDEEQLNKNQELNKKNYVIYSWGSGLSGKLGHGNIENVYVPKMI